MKFINRGPTTKVRIEEVNGFLWKTAHNGKIIELPEEIGKNQSFEVFKEVPVKVSKPKGKKK